jgi:proteasome lid subunit RPN8/RPN11
METQSAIGLARWTAEECPFAIEYSLRILDDIRLAVTDAFFSLPRGGAEIGGLLLGRQERGGLTVLDAVAMPCEHAFGPSFELSPRDHERLAELVAATDRKSNMRVVGWYHSHTRSEIYLSEADLEIHNRFFPESWQVALVLKPHTFQPMRAGFFFREKSGAIHATAPYREFVLDPLPMRPVPTGNAVPEPSPLFRGLRESEPEGPVINVSSVVETVAPAEPVASAPEPVATPAPELPVEVAPPSFLATPPPPSRRWAVWLIAALLGTSLGAWGYHTRAEWLPARSAAAAPAVPDKVELASIDREGQLQIRWNGNSRAVQSSIRASLRIVDGDKPLTMIELDRLHVLTGSFTYARASGRVDVTLVLSQTDGTEVREATLFAGQPPAAAKLLPPAAPEPAAPPALRALEAENARLKEEVVRQTERAKRYEKAYEEQKIVMQRERQRRRLELQNPDSAK